MRKRPLNISVDEDVYEGLLAVIGKRKISQFLNALARPYVIEDELEAAYRETSADLEREEDARAWCESFLGDIDDDPWDA